MKQMLTGLLIIPFLVGAFVALGQAAQSSQPVMIGWATLATASAAGALILLYLFLTDGQGGHHKPSAH